MDEINIRDVIGLIIKRKWIIIGFTVACVLASGIFSYFIATPGYNAKVTFNVEPVEMKSGIDPESIVIYNGDAKTHDTSNRLENKVIGSIINQVKYPNYNINAMTNMINSEGFRNKVYSELKLNKNISFSAVCNSDAKVITVIASSIEPGELVKACKTIFEYFPQYISNDAAEQIKRNNEILVKGLAEEKSKIEKYKKELDIFKVSIGGTDKIEGLSGDKQVLYQEAVNNYVLANQAFDSYKLVEKELEIIKQSDVKTLLNINLMSQDSAAFKVSPRVTVNVVLGAVIGFIFCFVVVFFMEYWPKRLK